MQAGRAGFFGSVSKSLASVVEYAFSKSGRPNGYILGTDAGGAFVAGSLRRRDALHQGCRHP
ncbi:MAG: EipA family protein [Hyphomicrobium sp.]